jgi:carbon monoxide dehydrogenase subunit G
VWDKLSDARFLAGCVPGAEAVQQAERDKALCTIRPGFSFVRGTLELTLQVAEAVPDQSIRLLVHTKGIGSTSDVQADLTLAPQAAGTLLHWTIDIRSLGGLLKAVPQGLVKAAAQKVVADALATVETRLGE